MRISDWSSDVCSSDLDWLTCFADELNRALVEADHRALRIGVFRIEIEHILHAGNVLAVDRRHAPHLLAPGLELVLGQAPTHRLAREGVVRSEEHTSELQSLMRNSYAVFCWKKNNKTETKPNKINKHHTN